MPRNKTVLAIALGIVIPWLVAGCGANGDDDARRARLGLPDPGYVADAMRGGKLYGEICRSCHGPGGRGTPQGPPLLHGYYRPDHHADYAFYMAVKNGVVQHHWEFGNMPALPQVSPQQAADVIAYVRALQRRAGLLN